MLQYSKYNQLRVLLMFQLQGVKWIKQKYSDTLKVIRLGQRGYLDVIEQSITSGATVLLENIEENVDPVLDPLLGRNLIKKGKYVFKIMNYPNFESPNAALSSSLLKNGTP